MNARSHFFPVVVAGVLLGTGLARAGEPDRPIRLEIEAGALAGGSDPVVHTDFGSQKVQSDAGPALAIGGGYAITDHVELDGTAQEAASGTHLFGRDIGYSSVTAGARYYPLGRHEVVRPWLIGQAGWYQGRSVFTGLFSGTHVEQTDNGAGLNVGGGLDVPVGKLVSLGVDVRYNQTFGVFNDPGFVTTMANVAFHFGS